MENEKIVIRMRQTVTPDILFLCKPNTIAVIGKEYNAISNKYGAVCVICDNGEKLGVKPNEFEFIEAPEWLLSIHMN